MTDGRIRESDERQRGRRVRYERPEGEPPSIAAATALARYNDEDVTAASTQLYDYVDPEALDALFDDTCTRGSRSVAAVEFDVDGVRVTVRPDRVEVAPN
ncbi:HalOD1 output domain-containing protein [Halopiger xanaduensis]|uniref:Halobacterial output domain-containing protein n=1 Tax=Halopiger xanaduensis (strain DSM 18323 / JCM 14033 / SH-6) TaxID=797210 RepID=F8D4I7_HALXS|nr:HalOD1 output domain-containing protein [Halopiger xanaduensis]AEH36315.1 hypothetical protein Halxa_1683 [Halopiger xanaduensis SH-6]